jgi:ribosomal protein S27AE
MFKRIGTPTKIEKVVAFDVKSAEEISCPKCSASVGLRSAGTFKGEGKKTAEIPLSGFQAKCPKCAESFNV